MISTTFLFRDLIFWLLVVAGPLIGLLIYRMLSRRPAAAAVTEPVQPTPIVPDHMPVPTQRVGIPSTALVRIQEACGGHIKDGELDIRFELRSRRDCDKMVNLMREMKENLQRTKSIFSQAEAGIRAQLDGTSVAPGKNTGRVAGLFGRGPALAEEFVTVKRAELDGYEKASQLVDKFIQELGATEESVLELPFYAPPPTVSLGQLQPQR